MILQQQQEQEQGRRASGSSIALPLSFKCRPQLSFRQQKFSIQNSPHNMSAVAPTNKINVFKSDKPSWPFEIRSMFGTHDPASFESGKPVCARGLVPRQDDMKGMDLAGNWAYGAGLRGPWYCARPSNFSPM